MARARNIDASIMALVGAMDDSAKQALLGLLNALSDDIVESDEKPVRRPRRDSAESDEKPARRPGRPRRDSAESDEKPARRPGRPRRDSAESDEKPARRPGRPAAPAPAGLTVAEINEFLDTVDDLIPDNFADGAKISVLKKEIRELGADPNAILSGYGDGSEPVEILAHWLESYKILLRGLRSLKPTAADRKEIAEEIDAEDHTLEAIALAFLYAIEDEEEEDEEEEAEEEEAEEEEAEEDAKPVRRPRR